jgi:cytochrome c-type biogenesis protein CcmH/NrfF
MKRLTAVFIVMMLAVAAGRAQTARPTVESIGNKVMCLCGCVAVLNQCPHQGCATHEEVKAVIEKLIAEGKDEPAILQELTARYGMKILAAPPAQGFNIAAWLLPGFGLIFGLVAVFVVVRRLRKPAAAPSTAPAEPASVDPKVLAAMEEEMKTTGLGTRG